MQKTTKSENGIRKVNKRVACFADCFYYWSGISPSCPAHKKLFASQSPVTRQSGGTWVAGKKSVRQKRLR